MSTMWTMLFEAHGEEADAATAAMTGLAQRYSGVVYRYLLARALTAAENWTDNVFRGPAPCARRSDRRMSLA